MSFAPLQKKQAPPKTHRTTATTSKRTLQLGGRSSWHENAATTAARFGSEFSPAMDRGHQPTSNDAALSPSISAAINGELAGGEPLPDSLRALTSTSPRGEKFDNVRYHHDSTSDTLARSLGAPAFTVNSHIFFKSGAYAPTLRTGQQLLAHELLHATEHGPGIARRAPPQEGEAGADLAVPTFLLNRIDDLPTIVPDGAGWRVRFPTDQVWEYEPKALVLAAYVAVGRRFLADPQGSFEVYPDLIPYDLPYDVERLLPMPPLFEVTITDEIEPKEIENAAAQLMEAQSVRDFGPQYHINPHTRAFIDITVDLDAVLRLKATLGATLSNEGEREVISARTAQFLEDALLYASVELNEEIFDIVDEEELKKLGISAGMVFGPWAVGSARRFAARKMQGTLAAFPFIRAFSSDPKLASGDRPARPEDFSDISLKQWKTFVLAAAKEVRMQYEKQTAERSKQLEDEARADLLGAHELSAVEDPLLWSLQNKNPNAETTVDLGVLGEQVVRGGDIFLLQGAELDEFNRVLVLDIVADQIIYIASNNKIYSQHKAGFGELLKTNDIIKQALESEQGLRTLKESEMLLLKALFFEEILVAEAGILFLQTATVLERDLDEMQRQWALLRATMHYTYEHFPGLYVACGEIYTSLENAVDDEDLLWEFFLSAFREDSWVEWLKAMCVAASRAIGLSAWTAKFGVSLARRILRNIRAALVAGAAGIRPWVTGYLTEENIGAVVELSKEAIAAAEPKLAKTLVEGLVATLADIAVASTETTWDELIKELQAGAAAADELAGLLEPLLETL